MIRIRKRIRIEEASQAEAGVAVAQAPVPQTLPAGAVRPRTLGGQLLHTKDAEMGHARHNLVVFEVERFGTSV